MRGSEGDMRGCGGERVRGDERVCAMKSRAEKGGGGVMRRGSRVERRYGD